MFVTLIGEFIRDHLLPFLAGVGALGVLLWIRIAGAEPFFSGFAFKSFVARRYLLEPKFKWTRETLRLIAIGLVLRAICELAFGSKSIAVLGYNDPFWYLTRAIEIAVLRVMVNHSRPAIVGLYLGIGLWLTGLVLSQPFVLLKVIQFLDWVGITPGSWLSYVILGLVIGGLVIAGLAVFFGTLRAFFTFFTTVPLGGVWLGTAALVFVLAVMNGFESDLRDKILGSNAHLQIAREDGDFTEWRQVKAQIDRVPGVLASTPFAVSEVVIAADNNGNNVIIKGIDPATVGSVTQLVRDIEPKDDREEQAAAMKRLEPLADDLDRKVPQGKPTPGAIDPSPADMPAAADPIDYSKPRVLPSTVDDDKDDRGAHPGSDAEGSAGSAAAAPPAPTVVDPAPKDLLTTDEPPADYSYQDSEVANVRTHDADDIDEDGSMAAHRTRSLSGVLVGRELSKQMHLYRGKEVRVVSPLSDPSNPDATGTPIPYNRDFRVAGFFFTGMYEYDLKYVYVTLEALQNFLDRGDAVDGIEVRIESPDDSEDYVKRIGELLGPQYRVQDWRELNHSLFSALKLEKIAMFFVLGIVILVASFSIIGNLIMVVVEKAKEIALLKTLGASDAGLMHVFAIQGLMIGIVGTALGVATGVIGCVIGQRVGIPLNPDVYYIDKLPMNLELGPVAITSIAGVAISVAATFYPALLAARVRPAAGLRH